MRSRNLIWTSVVFAFSLCNGVLAIESPVSNNPLGPGTSPPSAYQSGLIPSINPIDTSGNLVVTGNVAGGMHFRGIVPYRGVTDFLAPDSSLKHTSGGIDSFLRRSTGSQDLSRPGSGITPYYSPAWSVVRTTPGDRKVLAPQGGFDGSFGADTSSRTSLQREQTGFYKMGYETQLGRRPLSMGQQELERMIDADITQYPQGGEPALRTESQRQFWQQLRVPVETRPEPAKSEVEGIKQWESGTGTEPNIGMLLNYGRESRLPALGREGILRQPTPISGPDVYEQMKIKLGKAATDIPGLTTGISEQAAGRIEANEPAKGTKGDLQMGSAASVVDVYKSFAAYRDDKFNKHIRAAESYMKQGRFYRAADAYTIASVYKPDDPLGSAGKSQALFATGEYLSSALFLARAIEIFPEYAKFKVDLVEMIGDKDLIEKRILEAREWADRSGSGELEFLLSYIYCQMNRMEFARLAIESAAKKMPDSQAVAAMKKAIDERLQNQ